jgi:hypothetical protein
MPTRSEFETEKTLSEILSGDERSGSKVFAKGAFVERLPLALTYAANLEPQDSAVLFYDNLVVAAEYFCAFIEEGIRRHEVTCLTGLEPLRYHRLFEQVGIRVEELENSGYLRNLSANDLLNATEPFNTNVSRGARDDPLSTGLDDEPTGIRFLHVQSPRGQQKNSLEDVMETERRAHRLSSFPTTSICCYDARLVLDTPSNFFKNLLEAHDHCLFQGLAMPTSKLLDLRRSPVYPRLKST